MKHYKRLLLLAISFLLAIGLCGLKIMTDDMFHKIKDDMFHKITTDIVLHIKADQAERAKDIALEYLNENYDYGDTFKSAGYTAPNWAYHYTSMRFFSEKYSGRPVEVRIYENDGTRTFEDDYFKLYMEEDAVSYFKSIADRYIEKSEIEVRFASPELPDSLHAKSTFADYVASEKCHMDVYMISDSTFNENDVAAILSDIRDAQISGLFWFMVTSDEEPASAHNYIEKKHYSIYDGIIEQAD